MPFARAMTREPAGRMATTAFAEAMPSAACGRTRPLRIPVECGNLPFLIRRDGTWLYRGSPINRKELVCLFASVLKRDEDGGFWLETPAERGRIEVVTAGPEHPIRVAHDLLTCEPTPYILVRAGKGERGIEARINRAVYYELVALAVPEWVGCRRMLGVWSCGRFFPLGELPPGEE